MNTKHVIAWFILEKLSVAQLIKTLPHLRYQKLNGVVRCGPSAEILSISKLSFHPYQELLRNGSINNNEVLLHIILFWGERH
jgi:hypothetical protein